MVPEVKNSAANSSGPAGSASGGSLDARANVSVNESPMTSVVLSGLDPVDDLVQATQAVRHR